MRRAWPLLAAALLVNLLAACASPSRSPGEPAWTTGRLSVRIESIGDQKPQSMSAAFELQGDGQSGELRLNSPLGSRVVSARWAPGEAVLGTSEGERHFESLDALSRTALGEVVPLAALPAWLLGRPWEGAPSQATDSGFEQLGWQVVANRRDEGWIEARRSAAPAVLVRIRLDAPA